MRILILCLSILIIQTVLADSNRDLGGEVLPSDPWAVSTFSKYSNIISDKKAVLFDLALYIKESPAHLDKYGNDNQLLSLITDDQLWPIALGGGHASKLFFDMLENYYKKYNHDQKVIYRTIESKQIEYYAVPNSYILVYRNISDPGFYGTGNYSIVTRSPDIWRASFSVQKPRDNYTVSSLGVDKRYAQDILDVIKATEIAGITLQEDWTSYSHLISITARKLY